LLIHTCFLKHRQYPPDANTPRLVQSCITPKDCYQAIVGAGAGAHDASRVGSRLLADLDAGCNELSRYRTEKKRNEQLEGSTKY